MPQKARILFVCSRPRDRKAAAHLKERYELHFLDIDHNTRFNVFNFDILNYLEEAREIIKNKQINGICYGSDLGSMVAAVLCEEFKLPGPSLESTFKCYHKYATRESTKSNLDYAAHRLQELEQLELGQAYFLKAPTSAVGVLGFSIRNNTDLQTAIETCNKDLPKMNAPILPFFEQYLSREHYPYAFENIMLQESLIQAEQITIEGFVHHNNIHYTVITDTNTYPGTNRIDNFSLPTKLPNRIQNRIKTQVKKDITAIGLNNSFFNAEYFYNEHNIWLIEVNSRATCPFYKLFKEVYNYDVYAAALELCLGNVPQLELKAGQHGAQFNCISTANGPSAQLFNYDLDMTPELNIFVKKEDLVQQRSEFGVVIAQLELFGNSYEEIKKRADEMRSQLLKEKNPSFHQTQLSLKQMPSVLNSSQQAPA